VEQTFGYALKSAAFGQAGWFYSQSKTPTLGDMSQACFSQAAKRTSSIEGMRQGTSLLVPQLTFLFVIPTEVAATEWRDLLAA
jgi:hypothetical protein